MITTTLTPEQTLAEYNRVRDAARQRAMQLRHEAIDSLLGSIGRATTRLLARKARHQRLRTSLEA